MIMRDRVTSKERLCFKRSKFLKVLKRNKVILIQNKQG